MTTPPGTLVYHCMFLDRELTAAAIELTLADADGLDGMLCMLLRNPELHGYRSFQSLGHAIHWVKAKCLSGEAFFDLARICCVAEEAGQRWLDSSYLADDTGILACWAHKPPQKGEAKRAFAAWPTHGG